MRMSGNPMAIYRKSKRNIITMLLMEHEYLLFTHLQLAGGEIDTGNDLGAGVFNLKTGVELEEEVLLGVWVVEVLHCPCATIANEFGEAIRVLKLGRKWN